MECVGFCEYDKYAVASYTSMYLITEEQREYLSTLPLKKRQEEILKEEYRNGLWYRKDIRTIDARELPGADIYCFGAPCQDFSLAGRRDGLTGDRSSLVGQVFRLIEQTAEEKRPQWLIYENVKGMLSSNGGKDYLAILSEMDRLGYDAEWQNINSKDYVPQNRERIYTVGHLRAYGGKKVFPLQGADGENRVPIKAEGGGREPMIISERERTEDCRQSAEQWSERESDGYGQHSSGTVRNGLQTACVGSNRGVRVIGNTHPSGRGMNGNVFSSDGISPTLTTNKGEGVKIEIGGIILDKTIYGTEREIANTITAREDRGVSKRRQEGTAIGIIVDED